MASNLLADMHDIMIEKAIEPSVAEQVIKEISVLWAGINAYIPKRHVENTKRLKREICRDYHSGVSVSQLVKKYDVTQAWIYKIIKDNKASPLQPQSV